MRRLVIAVVAALVVSGCNSLSESPWEQLDDIAYVLPSHLPSGWTVAYATERPGRPFEEWESHAELYVNEARKEFISIGASKARRGQPTAPTAPAAKGPFDSAYLVGYVHGGFENYGGKMKSLQTSWRSSTLQLGVIHDSTRPSAALVKRVAAMFENETDLGFTAPQSVAPGFELVGGAGEDVTDYTIVLAPKRYAGESRGEATDLTDDAPTIGINVGAHFYAQRPELTTLDDAKAERQENGRLRIEFLYRHSSVSVGSDALSGDELMAVAKSLKSYGLNDWRKRLGERLLTQDPPDSPER